MNILINNLPTELPDGSTLDDAVTHTQPQPPFAAAVNKSFVPRTRYAATPLANGDCIDLIVPVTGG
jgi:sulfur carrier protein